MKLLQNMYIYMYVDANTQCHSFNDYQDHYHTS